jgi:hypothetical protein
MINAQNMLEDSVLSGKYLYGTEDIIAACRCHSSRLRIFVSCLNREQPEIQFGRKISAA